MPSHRLGGSNEPPRGLERAASKVAHFTVFVNTQDNPNAITRGGVDPRPRILLPVARELRARGHAVVLEGAAALSRRAPHTMRGIAAWRAEGFTFGLSNKVLKQNNPPTLAIVWFVEIVEPQP